MKSGNVEAVGRLQIWKKNNLQKGISI